MPLDLEIRLEYWNTLANITILTSALLIRFSVSAVTNLLVFNKKDKLTDLILKSAMTSTGYFLVIIFAMTPILMTTTTEGYLKPSVINDFLIHSVIEIVTVIIGLLFLVVIISLSGWIAFNRSITKP
ncbi:hypothetical protein ES692_08845 [Psychroserpens burtonensis]|uniref:Uncharacterized protein n=1 Tax=Psychroserpens burtonensis TaxID=49278 RepID=A0A5C7BEC6_9FLAO|nr:hypothetical protein [Psychroserpens burtonensis]TXE17661.1 hypothetical protein ES692_08845 [Psychroserpens burtonensis]